MNAYTGNTWLNFRTSFVTIFDNQTMKEDLNLEVFKKYATGIF